MGVKRRVIIPVVAISLVALSGGVFAVTRPQAPHDKPFQLPVTHSGTKTTPSIADEIKTRDTVTPVTPEVVGPEAPAPVIVPKTTAELKAEAEQKITELTGNPVQFGCFDKIIDYRYGWDITEAEMLHRIDTINSIYASFCSGLNVVRQYGGVGTPPGFRD
jgi:hypothetical protein